jgi:hypothetical protein
MLKFAAFVLKCLCEARHAGPGVAGVAFPAVPFSYELVERGVALGPAPSTSHHDDGDDAKRDANNPQEAECDPNSFI